ncbi:MAG: AAA family ATPase [Mesorhizobium sp.]
MTIEKIISIRNVGRFKNSTAVGDVAFKKHSLIFAENGRGKTTLCAILRSLQSGEAGHIVGRQTLGGREAPNIRFLWSGRPIAFSNGAWDRTIPEIVIYDGSFVADNIHAGEVVGTDHRRNLYRVIIGEQGVILARRMDDLDKLIREKNGQIRDARTTIERNLPQGMNLEAFLDLPDDPAIAEKIAAKETELRAARETDQLQRREPLMEHFIPRISAALPELLHKAVAGVADDAAERIAAHRAGHSMGERGEAWIAEGFGYIRNDSCPFCAQSVAGRPLIDAYRAFFSEAYERLRAEIDDLTGQVEEEFGDRKIAAIEKVIEQNVESIRFWRTYCDLAEPVLARVNEVGDRLRGVRQGILSALSRKAQSPLTEIMLDRSTVDELSALLADAVTYNLGVATANDFIAERKRKAEAADLTAINIALLRLRAQQARHTAQVDAACGLFQQLSADKTDLENEKTTKRERLDEHTAQLIALYGDSINRFLSAFNAGFRISSPTHSYRGGTPSSSYQIIINGVPVDLGDASTPLDKPSFRNTLSAGDRNTLALALFFAQVERHPQRGSLVVVFDDPFTSQDNFRRSHTAYQIKRCGDRCAQVIVLSHDQAFLKLVWDKLESAQRKTLQLVRIGEENTTIAEWDVEKACQARYKLDVETLQRYHALGEGDPRDVIQKIRPVLEGYCRNLYPTQFGESEMMGGIVSKIRGAGTEHPLFAVADAFEEINEFCRRYHHGESADAAIEPIDDNELQGYAKRTLVLTGCF